MMLYETGTHFSGSRAYFSRFELLQKPRGEANVTTLGKVTAAAFGQRRKMLRSSLKQLGGGALCEAAGIDPDAHFEALRRLYATDAVKVPKVVFNAVRQRPEPV